jgi:hypothetical protein
MNPGKRCFTDFAVCSGTLLAVFGLLADDAAAGGRLPLANDPLWRAECGSCHVAYPPQLLAAPDWRATMATLDRHFGSDASLPAEAAARIAAFLEANAGGARHAGPTPDGPRITATRWFRNEHDEVPPRTFTSAAVRSAANCAACHEGAERGDYSERRLRVPGSARAR